MLRARQRKDVRYFVPPSHDSASMRCNLQLRYPCLTNSLSMFPPCGVEEHDTRGHTAQRPALLMKFAHHLGTGEGAADTTRQEKGGGKGVTFWRVESQIKLGLLHASMRDYVNGCNLHYSSPHCMSLKSVVSNIVVRTDSTFTASTLQGHGVHCSRAQCGAECFDVRSRRAVVHG